MFPFDEVIMKVPPGYDIILWYDMQSRYMCSYTGTKLYMNDVARCHRSHNVAKNMADYNHFIIRIAEKSSNQG